MSAVTRRRWSLLLLVTAVARGYLGVLVWAVASRGGPAVVWLACGRHPAQSLLVVLVLLIGLVVSLPTAGAPFTATTRNPVNSFSAATSFCGPLTVTATADSYVHNGNKTTNYGTATTARSAGGMEVERTFVQFALPSLGNCRFSSATLRLSGNSGSTDGVTRQIDVARVATAWAETTITWNNQPAVTGTPASLTATNGVHSFDVTSQVSDMYAGIAGNTSFRVSYQVESGGGGHRWYTTWSTREATSNRPLLEIARAPA